GAVNAVGGELATAVSLYVLCLVQLLEVAGADAPDDAVHAPARLRRDARDAAGPVRAAAVEHERVIAQDRDPQALGAGAPLAHLVLVHIGAVREVQRVLLGTRKRHYARAHINRQVLTPDDEQRGSGQIGRLDAEELFGLEHDL